MRKFHCLALFGHGLNPSRKEMTRRVHTSTKSCDNKQIGKAGLFFLYPDGDRDYAQNFMGSKLDQDPSSDSFFRKIHPVIFA